MRGRKPTPTSTLKMRGSYREDRHGNRLEIEPSIPSCPSWLDARAKTEWRRLSKELSSKGMLTKLDRTILALHCQSLSDYQAAKELVNEAEKKGTMNSFAIRERDKAWQRVIKTAQELGLSPTSRPRVAVDNTVNKSDSSKSRFFSK